jgi:hypothetical protein
MRTGRKLIIIAVFTTLVVDFLILRPPTPPQIVMPVARIRPNIPADRPKTGATRTKPMEIPLAESDPIQGSETNISPKMISTAQPAGILAGMDLNPEIPLDFSWSIFDWVEPSEYPMARFALRYVGIDRDAEDYWYAAINDPTLSADERMNLIEDLNEEGFPDPENLTADDLPLIERRIQIIELVGPDAMDEVNADAFAEAYKDLVDMYNSFESEDQPADSAPEMSGGPE